MALVNQSVEDIPRTSEIEFFSSLHGREKRLQRGIEKRDLQAAVKHGIKQKGRCDPKTGATRWMYTLGNLVYITDETSTKEITSYCRPIKIPMAPITPADMWHHEQARENLRRNPHLCTSHTVIVVDHSRSMETSDVMDFENRIKASFGMLALDFVAKRRACLEASATDVVSVMLMHDGVDVLFEREPIGLSLYNRLVEIHRKVKPRSHGNFLPSLDQAEKLLRDDFHQPGTALCLVFLSDGKPSDNATGVCRGSCKAAAQAICDRVSLLARPFRNRLSVQTLGFASQSQDFSVLESMAKAASAAGAKGNFLRPELSSSGLGSAIASAVSSLTETKSHLSTLVAPSAGGRVRRSLPPIQEKESVECDHVEGWVVYVGNVKRWEYAPRSHFGIQQVPWRRKGFASDSANGVAIRRVHFGEGAERLVYKMQEYDVRRGALVGELFAAKHSKRSLTHEDSESAVTAAKALDEAGKLAGAFNLEVQKCFQFMCAGADNYGGDGDGWNMRVDQRLWRVQFLTCSLYSFSDAERRRERYILAERWLDPHRFRKWNGNNGYVFRGRGHSSLQPPSTGTAAQQAAVDAHVDRLMDEGGGEAIDYGAGAAEYIRGGGGGGGGGGGIGSVNRKRSYDQMQTLAEFLPRPTDYLQAFSHFSYHHSQRKMLVCDLQGVMSQHSPGSSCAGVFELTDPVIHYQSKTGKKQEFGRTDLGRRGVREFFKTHECNDVCRLLCLPGARSPEVEAAAKAAKAAAKAGRATGGGRGKRQRMYIP